jgi:hypothetical protein
MPPVRLLILAGLFASSATAARAESPPIHISQNDGHIGGPATFRDDLLAGDIIAVRLRSSDSFSTIQELQIVFGGTPSTAPVPVTIKIWDDTAEMLEPGVELLSLEILLTPSPLMQPIFLPGFRLPLQFRVGIVLRQSAPPMIGHDTDGTIDAGRNFIHRLGSGWQSSQAGGATGDWIIRAMIFPSGGGGDPGPGPGPDPGACGAPCPEGQFCDQAMGSCTFECVTSADCGGAFCNRFGQCVGEGGYCDSGGSAGAVAPLLGLGALALVLRGRRRRR